jgi:MFS family permease
MSSNTFNIYIYILSFIFFILGPLASILIHRFGTRTVAISGAIITSLGFLLSAFAPNIYWLCLTFGVINTIKIKRSVLV